MTRSTAVPKEQLKFVERFGLILEQAGQPPMTGRVLGWLLICAPPEQSMTELTEVLQASKGSISTSLQALTQLGWVERVRKPGERRNYFRIPVGVWTNLMKKRMLFLTIFRQLAEDGLKLMRGQDEDHQRRMREMHDAFSFYEREMPALIEHWEQAQKG